MTTLHQLARAAAYAVAYRKAVGSESQRRHAADRVATAYGEHFERTQTFKLRVPITKLDDEQRLAWGWAYVAIDDDGNQVVDHSGDVVSIEEIQNAAEGFIRDSRKGNEVHENTVGHVVHSLVITDDVAKLLEFRGKRRGWFVGLKVLDDAAWAGVKSGKYRAFSIGGSADVEELDEAQAA